jgi:hypothetical protein
MGKDALTVLVSVLLLGVAGLAGAAEKAEKGPDLETRFRKAFPGDDRVLQLAIRFDHRRKGLLMAAESFTVLDDGRVGLTDFAMAWVGKGDSKSPVTAVRSAHAVLTLDKPIARFHEVGSRKILSIELANGVRLTLDK